MSGAPTASLKNSLPAAHQENAAYYGQAPPSAGYYGYAPPAAYLAQQPGYNAYSAQSVAYGNVYGAAPTAYSAQPPPPATAYAAPPGAYAPAGRKPEFAAPPAPKQPLPTSYVPTKAAAPLYASEPVPFLSEVQPAESLVQATGAIFPNGQGVKGRADVPLGAVYSLMREPALPVVYPQGSRLVRCVKCRGYINCYVHFSENGSKWVCNLCGNANEVSNEFYCALNSAGERQDKLEKPELCEAAVEFIASPDYMTRPPMAPTFVLLIDVSRHSVQSGFLQAVCASFKEHLNKLSESPRAQLAIMTYDTNIHMYTPGAGSTPQISVVSGSSKDVFLPLADLLVHVKDNLSKLQDLLEHLPTYWAEQSAEEVCLAGIMTACRLLLRHCGGKLILCQSALPTAPELGLNPTHDLRRKDAKGRVTAAGTLPDAVDGVKPSSPYFSNLANALAATQICVDLLLAPPTPIQIDLATIGCLARYTGGQIYYYAPGAYRVAQSSPFAQIAADLGRSLDVVGWEGVMRVRCSKGWKISKYHGNYCFRALDLIILPAFVSDQTVSVQFDITDAVTIDRKFYAQAAVLYTTPTGERRIRVVNHSVQTSANLRDVAMALRPLPALYVIAQNALDEAASGKLADGRSYIHNRTRALCGLLGVLASGGSGLPDGSETAQRQSNDFAAALRKSTAFRDGRDVSADERVVAWNLIRSCPPEVLYNYLEPLIVEASQRQYAE